MNRVETSTIIHAPPEAVFAFHDDPHNLARVLPPYLRIEIVEAPPKLHPGAVVACIMFVGPLRFDWKVEIAEHDPPQRFVDIQLDGPFRRYVHTHLFEDEGSATRITDIIEYELSEPLAGLAGRLGFGDRMRDVLEHSQQAAQALLEKFG